jgi:predicted mannosyl-3-phosphoglycerate phosphatase (HAD superfamily)
VDWRDARVVFQDIDGCLNTRSGPLPDGTGQVATVEQERMLGAIGRAIDESSVAEVVLNTGRGLDCMDFVVAGLASRKVRYLLAEHGAVAFDVRRARPIDLHGIARQSGPPERAARYAQLGPIRDAIDWYRSEGESQLSVFFGQPLPALPKSANLTMMIPPGVPSSDVVRQLARSLAAVEAVDSSAFVYHASALYVDVMSEVSKGDGALLLLDALGEHPSGALAMGDGENDLSMFEVLASGFCPANSAAKLKRLCRQKAGVVSELDFGEAALEFYRGLG